MESALPEVLVTPGGGDALTPEEEVDPALVLAEEAPPASPLDILEEDTEFDHNANQDEAHNPELLPAVPLPESVVGNEPEGELFPIPEVNQRQKDFWIQIFTVHNSEQGLIHDGRIALPIWDRVELSGLSYRQQVRTVERRKKEIAEALRRLASAMEKGEGPPEADVWLMAKVPPASTPDQLREFARYVRFQRGLADRFREGLERSAAYTTKMREILKEEGVPEDLVYLPHVESTFNLETTSKYGAAGIWQFTRGTGKLYMEINNEVDQRRDPLIATRAAGKFLRQNRDRLGTWPLAITAYNHGPVSIERAINTLKTRDMGAVILGYEGRSFKFASKNFYSEFLAAREVASNPEHYFSDLKPHPEFHYVSVSLPFFLDAEEAASRLKVSLETLKKYNPSLRRAVWNGSKYIPKGFHLRLPAEADSKEFLASLPEESRHDKQKLTTLVTVGRGDTLYSIGRQLGVSWVDIAEANNIGSARRLRPGQKLVIPHRGAKPPASVQAALAARTAAKEAEPVPVAAVQSAPVAQSNPGPLDSEKIRLKAQVMSSNGEGQAQLEDVSRMQNLMVSDYDPARKEGTITAVYGEAMGLYSEWAGVSVQEILQLNNLSSRSPLQPGHDYRIPLNSIGREQFEANRQEFHQQRMTTFLADYSITDVVKVKLRQGQSLWEIAQNNNVPMWLFYRENPKLLTGPVLAGAHITLPIVQAISHTGTPAGSR